MKSMTGYGTVKQKQGSLELAVTVKAVNGRFLEARFHAPKEYSAYETSLKNTLAKTFHRGTVDVYIVRKAPIAMDVQVNLEVAKKWIAAHRQLAQSLSLKVDSTKWLERISEFPQILEVRDLSTVGKNEKLFLQQVFSQALHKCDQERKREGLGLNRHLREIVQGLIKTVDDMLKLRERAKSEMQKKLNDKLKVLQIDVDKNRLAQEVVLVLDKSDITEELGRLKEHVNLCQQSLRKKEPIGKKLDFYSQELLREINTIGSKANYALLTEKVVLAKSLVEAFKEQVQNIE